MRDETTDLRDETVDGQHINPDGETDAEKGARIGGIGGAITGGIAGAAAGPLGAVAGAVIGGVVGAVASGAAVAAIDRVDGDSITDGAEPVIDNGIPGVQTGGHAVDGTPDTRGIGEKTADAITGDYIDDKTGKVVSDGPAPIIDNGQPGIQTGGYANDGTPDTRGMSEKFADAVTGDNIDDKTGKVVDDRAEWDDRTTANRYDERYDDSVGNGIPGIQTGGHAVDGTPDTRGISEKTADALTGDNIDDKTGKRV